MMNMFWQGVISSFSLVLGYFPAAITFGVVSTLMGFNGLETILISSLVFAGSSQFALITLMGTSHLNAILIPLFMNLRHVIYSSIISRRVEISKPHITAFGLTDEVFATSLNGPKDERFLWGLEFGGYSAWVLGTVLGVVGGEIILSNTTLSNSLIFSLTLLFFILLISRKNAICALLGGGIALLFNTLGMVSTGLLVAGLVVPFLVMTMDKGRTAR